MDPLNWGPLNYPLHRSQYNMEDPRISRHLTTRDSPSNQTSSSHSTSYYYGHPMAPERSNHSTDSNGSIGSFGSSPSQASSPQYGPFAQLPSAQGTTKHGSTDSRYHQQPSQSRPRGASSTPSDYSDKEPKERFWCTHEDCEDRRSFTRKADVSRHIKTTHEKEFLNCPLPRCARTGVNGFTRKDHLTEHLRGYHKEGIAKRKTTAPQQYPAV